ncbi:hypothetical protein G7K_5646-t1 [Saitoella complicata NRRL Y-17804]|uniref:Uncharacterized protein n=1 Tax=Saitoella complicata (strain BCRC 22490 / CBS 7301 / JCM 7358 / NBRC 10748 / NRRL Y-17804) TaxID=698492 RepID=A0A0E9NNU3_SAICN|nr:hypothetical protein G7K_5646-t1 [Saitoella complicata NRRL Y-17804]
MPVEARRRSGDGARNGTATAIVTIYAVHGQTAAFTRIHPSTYLAVISAERSCVPPPQGPPAAHERLQSTSHSQTSPRVSITREERPRVHKRKQTPSSPASLPSRLSAHPHPPAGSLVARCLLGRALFIPHLPSSPVSHPSRSSQLVDNIGAYLRTVASCSKASAHTVIVLYRLISPFLRSFSAQKSKETSVTDHQACSSAHSSAFIIPFQSSSAHTHRANHLCRTRLQHHIIPQ